MVTNTPNAVMREIAAMRRAGTHEDVCALRGYFSGRDGRTFSLVLDLCAGGELFAKVDKHGALAETDCWRYFGGMLAGVSHLHAHGIAHRDLKLENVLLGGPTLETPKICDFGLAHVYQRAADGSGFDNPSLSQWCGSRSYCPPEIMARLPYDGYRADYWSLGVALFAMCSGFFPVEEATQRDWRFSRLAILQLRGNGSESTTRTIYGFYARPCPLSPALIELLDSMIVLQPPRRLPLTEVAVSPWVVGGPTAPAGLPSPAQPAAPATRGPPGDADRDVDEIRRDEMSELVSLVAGMSELDTVDGVETVERSSDAAVGQITSTTAPPCLRRQLACSQRVGVDMEDESQTASVWAPSLLQQGGVEADAEMMCFSDGDVFE